MTALIETANKLSYLQYKSFLSRTVLHVTSRQKSKQKHNKTKLNVTS